MFSVSAPNPAVRRMLEAYGQPLEIIDWDLTGPAPQDHIDLIITPYLKDAHDPSFLAGTTSQLVQTSSIGYDHVIGHLAGRRLANAAGVHETATAELALAHLLTVTRNIPRAVRAQDAGTWDVFHSTGLADKRIVMIGYGGVGRAIEARLAGFEVDLVRVASRAREENGPVYGPESIPELISTADIVLMILPATKDTIGMVDDDFLAAMPDGAIFLNMARGSIADTDALVRHADRLTICFDVVTPEPLPAGHPLYSHPQVFFTAHTGGYSDAMEPRLERLLHRQLDHLLGGTEPENLIV